MLSVFCLFLDSKPELNNTTNVRKIFEKKLTLNGNMNEKSTG